jgi:hypothetical protein
MSSTTISLAEATWRANCFEVKRGFQLPSTDIQQMVSGEPVYLNIHPSSTSSSSTSSSSSSSSSDSSTSSSTSQTKNASRKRPRTPIFSPDFVWGSSQYYQNYWQYKQYVCSARKSTSNKNEDKVKFVLDKLIKDKVIKGSSELGPANSSAQAFDLFVLWFESFFSEITDSSLKYKEGKLVCSQILKAMKEYSCDLWTAMPLVFKMIFPQSNLEFCEPDPRGIEATSLYIFVLNTLGYIKIGDVKDFDS